MPPQRGPRGEKVHVVTWITSDGKVQVEVYAAGGLRAAKHKSAMDRVAELDPEDRPHVHHSVAVK